MRRAYVDAALIVLVTVGGSLLANAHTQAQAKDASREVCRALLDVSGEDAICADWRWDVGF